MTDHPNIRKRKLTELKGDMDSSPIVGDFNTPLTIMDLSNTINQLDLTDTYRTLYPTIIEYTFFSVYMGHFPGQTIL